MATIFLNVVSRKNLCGETIKSIGGHLGFMQIKCKMIASASVIILGLIKILLTEMYNGISRF